MKKIVLLLLLLPFMAFPQYSDGEKHPLDTQFELCEAGNTVEMIECAAKKYEAWDKEMNKYYKLLMGILGKEEKAALIESQRKWITYRDAEIAFAATLNRNKDGTMWPVIFGSTKAGIVRTRAMELIGYYETETMGE